MKLIPWIVALCNRKWQRKFDALVVSIENASEPTENGVELDNTTLAASQPTHLSQKFQSREKRHYANNQVSQTSTKEEALIKLMERELSKLA
jgi:hypothetical protein